MNIKKMKTEDLEKKLFTATGDEKAAIAKELSEREAQNDFGIPVRRVAVDATTKKNEPKKLAKKIAAKKAAVKKAAPKKAIVKKDALTKGKKAAVKKAAPKKAIVKKDALTKGKKAVVVAGKPSARKHIALPGVKNRADIIGKKVQFNQYMTGAKIKGTVVRLFQSNRRRTFVGIKTDTPGKYISKKLADVKFI